MPSLFRFSFDFSLRVLFSIFAYFLNHCFSGLSTFIPFAVFVSSNSYLSFFRALSFSIFFLCICASVLYLFCIFALYLLNPLCSLEVLYIHIFFIRWLYNYFFSCFVTIPF